MVEFPSPTYAFVVNSVILHEQLYLPDGAQQLGVLNYINGPLTTEQAESCGYFLVVDTDRPVDTLTHQYERTLELIENMPTVVWVELDKTQEVIDVETGERNADTIRSQADAARASNTAFLVLASPTNAQVLAQVKALTRQLNGLIRLATNKLDGTD